MGALNGLPGPYIKWFLEKIGLHGLNTLLSGFSNKNATAMTILAFCPASSDDDHILTFVGETKGRIVPPRGSTQFGWDAVFETKTETNEIKTYGEMCKEEKDSISHRQKAIHLFLD